MSTYKTFHAALVDKLRNSGVAGVDWGSNKNPYYEQVVEGTAFPYVVFALPDSVVEHTFEAAYTEEYKPEVTVVCLESDVDKLCSPYETTSIFYFLDGFRDMPSDLDGANFTCAMFIRESFVLHKSSEFGPNGARVYEATGVYRAMIRAG